jgi:hypothetical protein
MVGLAEPTVERLEKPLAQHPVELIVETDQLSVQRD